MTDDKWPDLVGWCGHAEVDLKTWQCPDCERPLPDAARVRLGSSPTKAPDGSVWVLNWEPQHGVSEENHAGHVFGVFSDRATIARKVIRGLICGAKSIRRIHWYQCAYNDRVFYGWEESQADDGEYDRKSTAYAYSLVLEEIDSVG